MFQFKITTFPQPLVDVRITYGATSHIVLFVAHFSTSLLNRTDADASTFLTCAIESFFLPGVSCFPLQRQHPTVIAIAMMATYGNTLHTNSIHSFLLHHTSQVISNLPFGAATESSHSPLILHDDNSCPLTAFMLSTASLTVSLMETAISFSVSFSRACCRHGSPSAQGKSVVPVSGSDIGAVAETKAPPSMLHERCLREPITMQRRRRNCTKAVPCHCVVIYESDSQVFLVTRPKRRSGAKRTLLHAGNLYAPPQEPSSPLGETPRSVSHSAAQCKRILYASATSHEIIPLSNHSSHPSHNCRRPRRTPLPVGT